jgi:predicted DNA-binding transcriptional regulator AlpA
MTIAGKPYPATLRVPQIAELYGYTVMTVQKMARLRNPKIPTPCTLRPYGWNRADVQRHYERRTA